MIKHLKYTLLLTVAGFAASGAAFATESGPYIGLGLGLNRPKNPDVTAQVPNGTPPVVVKGEFDTGYIGVANFGYKWNGGFRTELELGYRQAHFDELNGTSASGAEKIRSLSGNVLYDFDHNGTWTPYLGAGLGYSSNKWRDVATTGSPTFTDRDAAIQWQGIAGLSAHLSRRTEMFGEYRYIGVGKTDFTSLPLGSTVNGHSDRSHNFLLGVRFSLGKDAPAPVQAVAQYTPPPPPAPTPPPPMVAPTPPPPPVPAKYMVFFNFDRSTLTEAGRKIVDEAADFAKRNGRVVINVTGYADTSGSASYNLGLSERRAESVKAALTGLGLRANEITVSYRGESDLLVATGDGVKEPQNRRVEIVLQ